MAKDGVRRQRALVEGSVPRNVDIFFFMSLGLKWRFEVQSKHEEAVTYLVGRPSVLMSKKGKPMQCETDASMLKRRIASKTLAVLAPERKVKNEPIYPGVCAGAVRL